MRAMRRILVTGANKGIGLAIVEAILARENDTFVYLGSRDPERGRAAAEGLVRAHPEWKTRLEVVAIDVTNDESVAEAARRVAASAGAEKLYGIVNNAGVGHHGRDLAAVLETNTFGVRRVCEAFLPLLAPDGGRVVNVTSASGPTYVSKCSPELQRFFLDDQMTWPRLKAFLDERIAQGNETDAYGLSKAAANTYTRILAREHPDLRVNACTPGFIETDMTRHYAEEQGKPPAELGMKPPSEGAKAPLHLLFGALEGNGRYYGSDAKRSPLDRYRSPGSPEYTGP